jgi:hypothetical protein
MKMTRNVLVPLLSAIAACAGCASMLDLDQNYTPVEVDGGSSSAGGDVTSSSGGVVSGGGGSGSVIVAAGGRPIVDAGSAGHASGGVAPVEAGSCGPNSCGPTEKCCSSTCGPEQPLTGCGQMGCDPCPAPPTNGVAICENGACAVRCNEAYALSSGKCVPMTTGSGGAGAGGTTGGGGKGTGGATAQCPGTDTSRCPQCNIAGPLPCCRHDQTCGCSWAPGFACY